MALKDTLKKFSKPSLDFTLLTEEQILGDKNGNGQLDVIKKYGRTAKPTDLAAILGNTTSEYGSTSSFWTSSSTGKWVYSNRVFCLEYAGDEMAWPPPLWRQPSVRPVLRPTETAKLQPTVRKKSVNGVDVVEYGEYPQTVANDKTSERLESLHGSGYLHPTGKNYTFDSVASIRDYEAPFKATSYPEYELDGRKYIRVLGYPNEGCSELSTRKQVEDGKPYWVQVQPIEWLVDKSGTWVSKKCLLAGIQFDTKKEYNGDFSKTFMKKYLDTYFAKEIEPSERMADREVIKNLNAQLAEINDLEKLKTMVTPARTPERTEQLARITRVRKAKELLSAAAQKAYKDGDEATLKEIVEIAKPYAAREAAIRHKAMVKRLERRAARK